MLNVQKFILEHEDWEQLLSAAPYKIRLQHKIENEHDLVIFNYIQGASEPCEITNECRGLILDITDNCSIVRYGFYRFYNLGDPNGAVLGNKISTTEKVDGSLIFIYYYMGYWHISTRSTFEISSDMPNDPDSTKKLRKMYKQIMRYMEEKASWSFSDLDKDCTYCFEFVSPDFQIIIPYKEVDMYFLMCRNNKTLEEVETSVPFKRPKQYEFNSISDIEEYVSKFKSTEMEGCVVKDENNNRLKIKNLNWLKTHYLYNNGQFSDRYFIHLYFENDYDELFTYFPNLKERFNKVVNRYNTIKEAARLMDNIPVDTIMTKKQFFELVDSTVKDKGFQMLALKSYNNGAYSWFCMLDEYWYSHYFVKEDQE